MATKTSLLTANFPPILLNSVTQPGRLRLPSFLTPRTPVQGLSSTYESNRPIWQKKQQQGGEKVLVTVTPPTPPTCCFANFMSAVYTELQPSCLNDYPEDAQNLHFLLNGDVLFPRNLNVQCPQTTLSGFPLFLVTLCIYMKTAKELQHSIKDLGWKIGIPI